MDEKKLKRLAITLTDYLDGSDNPTDIYNQLSRIWKSQDQYFRHLKNETLFKLMFYVISLKKTGNFNFAEKMLNNLFFAGLFKTSGNNYSTECETCNGDGREECGWCSGDGRIDCDVCDGRGAVDCEECGGDGEDEYGEKCGECAGVGEVDCSNCAGEGRIDCGECDGSGSDVCSTCDGEGVIETEEYIVDFYQICSWDQDLKNKCELWEGTKTPVLSVNEFYDMEDQMIILDYNEEDHFEFQGSVEDDPDFGKVYCARTDDEPTLHKSSSMKFHTNYDAQDITW